MSDAFEILERRASRPLDLVRHLRVRGCRSCENCDDIAVCRGLDERGVWVLCEMPERDFVERCIERGLVPHDILEAVPAAGDLPGEPAVV